MVVPYFLNRSIVFVLYANGFLRRPSAIIFFPLPLRVNYTARGDLFAERSQRGGFFLHKGLPPAEAKSEGAKVKAGLWLRPTKKVGNKRGYIVRNLLRARRFFSHFYLFFSFVDLNFWSGAGLRAIEPLTLCAGGLLKRAPRKSAWAIDGACFAPFRAFFEP